MEIGRKILNLRKDLGLGQRTLAEAAQVTPSALSRIEAGIHQPRASATLGISRRFGVTADYILDEDAPYPPPAYEILANLVDTTREEPRETPAMLSERELRVVEAFRSLELERKRFLEAALAAPRPEVRFASWILGADLPGEDPREVARFRDRLRVRCATESAAESEEGPLNRG